MPLQVNGQPAVLVVENPAAYGSSLFGVIAVRDGLGHDAIRPIAAGKLRPVRPLPQPPYTTAQAKPKSFLHGRAPSGTSEGCRRSFAGAAGSCAPDRNSFRARRLAAASRF